MIKKISIVRYRKLEKIDLQFNAGLNLISGANGTCKSSLLHLICNSFKKVVTTDPRIKDRTVLGILGKINSCLNPKIETLTKGDKQYNDPAVGHEGVLFSVTYVDDYKLGFRRHNSGNSRFAVKPKYQRKAKEKLPAIPVVYLGLTRLFPIGEFQNDTDLKAIKINIPDAYKEEVNKLYHELTYIKIDKSQPQQMGNVKNRTIFSTEQEGVDDNTISAGEDNILIILNALFSLKMYFEALASSDRPIESVLVIDEFDATLHPALQIRLLEICRKFARDYKIQLIATTHSLSLLEYSLDQGDNVLYLVNDVPAITAMPDPDITKIKMDLKTIARKDVYEDKKIPVFTEDNEARLFLNLIFNYWERIDFNFKHIRSCFYIAETFLGCEVLRQIFKEKSLRQIMHAICILDGDKNNELGSNTIALPGKASPEIFIFEYLKHLYDSDDDFWRHIDTVTMGYRRPYYLNHVYNKYENIKQKIDELKQAGESTKGILRDETKKLWNDNLDFMEHALKHWINDPCNREIVSTFMKSFHILFCKTAAYHGISNRDWFECGDTNA